MLASGIKSVEDVFKYSDSIDVWEGHRKRVIDDQNLRKKINISESSAVRTTHPVHEVSVGFPCQQRHPGDH